MDCAVGETPCLTASGDHGYATQGETPTGGGCPVLPGLTRPTMGDANSGWWPNRLNLKMLAKNPAVANPMGESFDYAEEFKSRTAPRTRWPAAIDIRETFRRMAMNDEA